MDAAAVPATILPIRTKASLRLIPLSVPMAFGVIIFAVRHRAEPLGRAFRHLCADGDMREPAAGSRTMPVYHPGRDFHYIAGVQLADRSSFSW